MLKTIDYRLSRPTSSARRLEAQRRGERFMGYAQATARLRRTIAKVAATGTAPVAIEGLCHYLPCVALQLFLVSRGYSTNSSAWPSGVSGRVGTSGEPRPNPVKPFNCGSEGARHDANCPSLVRKIGAAGLVLSKPVVAAAQLADRSGTGWPTRCAR
jgi:hypothetical protein